MEIVMFMELAAPLFPFWSLSEPTSDSGPFLGWNLSCFTLCSGTGCSILCISAAYPAGLMGFGASSRTCDQ